MSKLITIILIMIPCLIGLLYHLGQISERCFKYQTRSQVHMSIPVSIPVPVISTFWFLRRMIDSRRLNSSTLSGIGFKSYQNLTSYYKRLGQLLQRKYLIIVLRMVLCPRKNVLVRFDYIVNLLLNIHY